MSLNTPITQVLARLSTYGEQHLAEIECDLTQLDALQDEAIKQLCASFIALHQAVDQQQHILDSMLQSGASLAEYASCVEATRCEVSRHTGEAVAGLQFQDMTSQLISRMLLHLSRLRGVLGALDVLEVTLHEEAHHGFPEKLDALRECVAAHCTEMSGGLRNTVPQRHLSSGEVELF